MAVKAERVFMSITKIVEEVKSFNLEFITVEASEVNLLLTLNRESKLNALNDKVLSELREVFSKLATEKPRSIGGLIFTGGGDKAFIAGADIGSMASMTAKEAQNFSEVGHEITLLLESLPFPTIAAVNGYALGGGLEIALSCDFIYATETAVFGLPEVSLGLIPGFGGTQRLARVIGRNRAKEIIFTGRNVKIDEAKNIGLVIKSVANKDELIAACNKTLSRVFAHSPNAIMVAKKAINKGVDLSINDGLQIESKYFGDVFNSDDMKVGTNAFMKKEKAQFNRE
jgi:enoyl-CoA hydratase